jgi:hypothetical protein
MEYATKEALEASRALINPEWVILPSDDLTCLRTGYVAFNPTDSDTIEYHYAPIYDSCEQCKIVEHENKESWWSAMESFKSQEDTTVYPCDMPNDLLLGFVIHPQREWHRLSILTFKSKQEPEIKVNQSLESALFDAQHICNMDRTKFTILEAFHKDDVLEL